MKTYRVPVQVNLEVLVEAGNFADAFSLGLAVAEELAKLGKNIEGVDRIAADGEIIDIEEDDE